MKTLIILPQRYSTYFRSKGLSIKAAGNGDAGHDLCKDEGGYYIDNEYKLNSRTAKIKLPELLKFLTDLYEHFPFDNIKIKGHYEATAEYLMEQIKAANTP